jgi:hypothetical protein
LYVWKHKKFPSWPVMTLFILSGLSGPMIIVPAFLIFVILSYKLYQERQLHPRSWIIGLAVVLVALFQVNISLENRAVSPESSFSLRNFLIYYPRVFFISIFDRLFFWKYQEFVQYLLIPTSLLIGMVIFLIVYYLNIHQKKLFTFSIIYIVLSLALTYYGAFPYFFAIYTDPFTDTSQRYDFIPTAIVIILLFSSANNQIRLTQIIRSILGIILFINIILNYRLYPFVDYEWMNSVKNYNPKSANTCEVTINPPGWKFDIPCD